jgi:hypothetical protein
MIVTSTPGKLLLLIPVELQPVRGHIPAQKVVTCSFRPVHTFFESAALKLTIA